MITINITLHDGIYQVYPANNDLKIYFVAFYYHNIHMLSLCIKSQRIDLTRNIINLNLKNVTYFNLCYANKKDNIYTFKQKDYISKNHYRYSTLCTAEFGDQNCRHSSNKKTFNVIEASNNSLTINEVIEQIYKNGSMLIYKNNIQYKMKIINILDNKIILNKDIPFFPDNIEVNTFCDKTYKNCMKYNNTMNFQGQSIEMFKFKYDKTLIQNLISFINNIIYLKETYYDNLHPSIKAAIRDSVTSKFLDTIRNQ